MWQRLVHPVYHPGIARISDVIYWKLARTYVVNAWRRERQHVCLTACPMLHRWSLSFGSYEPVTEPENADRSTNLLLTR